MIDFDAIGKRILEERKYLHRGSQEKMAEDLSMYHADISNLEKAKNGSGITDLCQAQPNHRGAMADVSSKHVHLYMSTEKSVYYSLTTR